MKNTTAALSIFLFLFVLQFKLTIAQKKNTLAFGFNVTNFSDWKKRHLNIFNPEVCYIKQTRNTQKIFIAFDAFYGEFPRKEKLVVGSIAERLNFCLKTNYVLSNMNSAVGIGPAVRMRNESRILYFYPPINPFEAVHDPNRSHFDFGLNANFLQTVPLNQKSKILVKFSYSLYNKGRNPLSLGFFYGKSW